MAFDWVNERIFWADQKLKRIFSMNVDASHRTTVIVSPKPRAIALNPCRGYRTQAFHHHRLSYYIRCLFLPQNALLLGLGSQSSHWTLVASWKDA